VFQALQAGAAAQRAVAEFGDCSETSDFGDPNVDVTGTTSDSSSSGGSGRSGSQESLHGHIEAYFRGDSHHSMHAMLTAVKTAADACRTAAVTAECNKKANSSSALTARAPIASASATVETASAAKAAATATSEDATAAEAVSAVAVIHEAGTLTGEAEARSSLPWSRLTPDVEEKVNHM